MQSKSVREKVHWLNTHMSHVLPTHRISHAFFYKSLICCPNLYEANIPNITNMIHFVYNGILYVEENYGKITRDMDPIHATSKHQRYKSNKVEF